MKKRTVLVYVICIAIAFAASAIGSMFTSGETSGAWYDSIRPSITPPNYVFPIVWTILFLLIGIALAACYLKANKRWRKTVILAFATNLILNVLWSWFYFARHDVLMAFFDIILLWISIVMILVVSYNVKKEYAWISVPYLLWVSFAAILNWLSLGNM